MPLTPAVIFFFFFLSRSHRSNLEQSGPGECTGGSRLSPPGTVRHKAASEAPWLWDLRVPLQVLSRSNSGTCPRCGPRLGRACVCMAFPIFESLQIRVQKTPRRKESVPWTAYVTPRPSVWALWPMLMELVPAKAGRSRSCSLPWQGQQGQEVRPCLGSLFSIP